MDDWYYDYGVSTDALAKLCYVSGELDMRILIQLTLFFMFDRSILFPIETKYRQIQRSVEIEDLFPQVGEMVTVIWKRPIDFLRSFEVTNEVENRQTQKWNTRRQSKEIYKKRERKKKKGRKERCMKIRLGWK